MPSPPPINRIVYSKTNDQFFARGVSGSSICPLWRDAMQGDKPGMARVLAAALESALGPFGAMWKAIREDRSDLLQPLLARHRHEVNASRVIASMQRDLPKLWYGGRPLTFLQASAVLGRDLAVKELLAAGADAAGVGGGGNDAHVFCPSRFPPLLLASGAGRDRREEISLAPGHALVVQMLLAAGADPNFHSDGRNGSALHFASKAPGGSASLKVMEALLAGGAHVNSRTERLKTPLHWAAEARHNDPEGQTEAIRILLAAGSDVNVADGWGRTPLHLAAEGGRAAAVRELLAWGADPRRQDELGQRPVHMAGNCVAVIVLLVAAEEAA